MVEARDIKHPWTRRALLKLTSARKTPEFGLEKSVYTARCPGIFNLQRHGWVMRTWQDITIETFGDGSRFEWTSAVDQKIFNERVGDAVAFHPKQQLADYMDNWPSNTLDTLVKIQTPWRCLVPKGYYLLEMPVAYSDENRFTTVHGVYSRDKGIAQMNPQFMWHVMNGKTLIKAGTPIAQYILVPKDRFKMEVRAVGEINEHEFSDLLMTHRFVKNMSFIKTFYGETK
jgi:hypothetical protein